MDLVLVVIQLAACAVAVVLFRSWRRVLDPVRTFAAAAIFAGIAGWRDSGLVQALAQAATFGIAGMWGTALLGPARGTPRRIVHLSPFAWPSIGQQTFVARCAILIGGLFGFVLLVWDLGPPMLQGAVTAAVVVFALLDLLIADARRGATLRRRPFFQTCHQQHEGEVPAMTGSPAELRARKAALEDLITLRGSVDDVVKQLRAFDWDTAPDLVTLTPVTVIDVLDRYLSGRVTADEIERWANGIEAREDIAFPALFETVLKELLFEIANPAVNRPLTPEVAREWTERLRDTPP